MGDISQLKAVTAQPGRPLYQLVRDTLRQAVDNGVFTPGEKMPSTKDLSDRLEVSLVTTHRALQELVSSGVLHRSQGRGTFVHERYHERRHTLTGTRVGLFFHRDASLADYYHSQVLEGFRQAAHTLGADLMLLRFGEDMRNECNGYLYINPEEADLRQFENEARSRRPALIVGARAAEWPGKWIDVDNIDLARQAVRHLESIGHARIGYVGGADESSNSRDRWAGFAEARGKAAESAPIVKGASWQLNDRERAALIELLSGETSPTAIFAAGYQFALDVYSAAARAKRNIPNDVSVIGVDDPMSAPHLSPPLTTLRQPLVELGRIAMQTLMRRIGGNGAGGAGADEAPMMLSAELVVRKSTAPPRKSP